MELHLEGLYGNEMTDLSRRVKAKAKLEAKASNVDVPGVVKKCREMNAMLANKATACSTFCTHRFEERVQDDLAPTVYGRSVCGAQAPYAVMVHSAYDLPLKNLVIGMQLHGVVQLKGCLIATPNMLFEEEGHMDILECNWKRIGHKIVYYFDNDSSYGYVHDWRIIRTYLKATHILDERTRRLFLIERDQYMHGTLYYTITAIPETKLSGREYFVSNAWLQELNKHYLVQLPGFARAGKSFTMKLRKKLFPRTLIDDVVTMSARSVTGRNAEKDFS